MHSIYLFCNYNIQLLENVPAAFRKCDMELLYSTAKHGYSIHTLYTTISRVREKREILKPIIIIIEDTNSNVSKNDQLYDDRNN